MAAKKKKTLPPTVIAVHRNPEHRMKKETVDDIVLLPGKGVEGDAHCGEKVKHRSRVAADPDQPNLRQVHLIHAELFEELSKQGYTVHAGQMGENITTIGLDLLGLSTDTVLRLGAEATIRITGLRNPCAQLDGIREGLMQAVLDKDTKGRLIRKAGIMAVVLEGGTIKAGDRIEVLSKPAKFKPLDRV